MAAGLCGNHGYDMARVMEELPPPNRDPIGIPDAIMVRPTVVIVFDAVKDSILVVTPVRPDPGVTAGGALTRASERLSAPAGALHRPPHQETVSGPAGPLTIPPTPNTSPEGFHPVA